MWKKGIVLTGVIFASGLVYVSSLTKTAVPDAVSADIHKIYGAAKEAVTGLTEEQKFMLNEILCDVVAEAVNTGSEAHVALPLNEIGLLLDESYTLDAGFICETGILSMSVCGNESVSDAIVEYAAAEFGEGIVLSETVTFENTTAEVPVKGFRKTANGGQNGKVCKI